MDFASAPKAASIMTLLLFAHLPACNACGETAGQSRWTSDDESKTPSPLVPHDTLVRYLPSFDGWRRSDPRGKTVTGGDHAMSEASVTYESKIGDVVRTAKIQIIDAEQDPTLFGPLSVMVHSESDVIAGHKKSVEVQGFHGIEQWQVETSSVILALVVKNRFLVRLEAINVPEQVVQKMIRAIDMKKLASLAK